LAHPCGAEPTKKKNNIMDATENLIAALQNSLINSISIEEKPDNDPIDLIHDLFLLLMKYERYQTIDHLFLIINPKKITLDDLLSILTMTFWCKDKLINRTLFFKKASTRLDVMMERGILDGLS
jgi:hypothetical protein